MHVAKMAASSAACIVLSPSNHAPGLPTADIRRLCSAAGHGAQKMACALNDTNYCWLVHSLNAVRIVN